MGWSARVRKSIAAVFPDAPQADAKNYVYLDLRPDPAATAESEVHALRAWATDLTQFGFCKATCGPNKPETGIIIARQPSPDSSGVTSIPDAHVKVRKDGRENFAEVRVQRDLPNHVALEWGSNPCATNRQLESEMNYIASSAIVQPEGDNSFPGFFTIHLENHDVKYADGSNCQHVEEDHGWGVMDLNVASMPMHLRVIKWKEAAIENHRPSWQTRGLHSGTSLSWECSERTTLPRRKSADRASPGMLPSTSRNC